MRKKMTPCEKLGYKVGDKFKVVDGTGALYAVGSFITLIHDDGSSCPRFNGVHSIFESEDIFFPLYFVEKVAKLKPAKQALADAIHQNGGWPNHCDCNFATSNDRHLACFFTERPVKGRFTEWSGWVRVAVLSRTAKPLPNWHQTILSRDEYFTAYPEQLKVDINNETKHKVEAEMTSESEMTINASSAGAVAGGDWHKNGELPPVGDVCEWLECSQTGWQTVTVAGYYLNAAWLVPKGKEPITVYNPTGFRPLRTEREKAIEEMVGVARDIGYSSNNSIAIIGDVASAMYDLGYRKEAK